MKKHLRVINDEYWAPDIVLFCVNIFYAAVNGGIPSQAWIFPSLHSVKKNNGYASNFKTFVSKNETYSCQY